LPDLGLAVFLRALTERSLDRTSGYPNPVEAAQNLDKHLLQLSLVRILSEAKDGAVNNVESGMGTPAISLRRTPRRLIPLVISGVSPVSLSVQLFPAVSDFALCAFDSSLQLQII